jgi:hypothetical protein
MAPKARKISSSMCPDGYEHMSGCYRLRIRMQTLKRGEFGNSFPLCLKFRASVCYSLTPPHVQIISRDMTYD